MSLSEFEVKKCEKELNDFLSEHRPPVHIRDKVDLSYRIIGQSVEIFEIRPSFMNSNEKTESAVAKSTYVKAKNQWNIYWQRADMKWHKYAPYPVAQTLKEFLDVVAEDEHGCFFG